MKERHDVQQRLTKIRHWLHLDRMPKVVRVVLVSVIGGAVLAAGIIMIVTPGPAFVLIPLGLFLLASEFEWAACWAQKLVDAIDSIRMKWRAWRRGRAAQSRS